MQRCVFGQSTQEACFRFIGVSEEVFDFAMNEPNIGFLLTAQVERASHRHNCPIWQVICIPSWLWLQMNQVGQTAGVGPCFHLPGQAILEFRFFEPQPLGRPRIAGDASQTRLGGPSAMRRLRPGAVTWTQRCSGTWRPGNEALRQAMNPHAETGSPHKETPLRPFFLGGVGGGHMEPKNQEGVPLPKGDSFSS